MAQRPPPYVLSGFPRMPPHVAQMEEVAGRLGLAIAAPGAPESAAGARASAAMERLVRGRGVTLHEARGLEEQDVEAVLRAMGQAGIEFVEPSRRRPPREEEAPSAGRQERPLTPPSPSSPPVVAPSSAGAEPPHEAAEAYVLPSAPWLSVHSPAR